METKEPAPTAPGHTAVCGIEHFSDEGLRTLLVDAFPDEGARTAGFPRGVEYRKHWEVAMALRAFRDLGVLHPDARILGVGAGTERTVFHLSRHVAEVVATDVYLGTGASEGEAQLLMLVSPWSCTRADFDPARLTVRHMDGRVLDFPDGSFDGVVSPSSIQRFGTDEEIAAAAFEMGRVLRPGGIAVISTDYLVMGPSGARGWPGYRLFSETDLRRLIVEAGGLELVGDLDLRVSPATLETARDVAALLEGRGEERGIAVPHLVAAREGQVFTSVQVTLRKSTSYPLADNLWASPTPTLKAKVRRDSEERAGRLLGALLLEAEGRWSGAGAGWTCSEPAAPTSLVEAFDAWDAVRARTALAAPPSGPAWNRVLGFVKRTAGRLRDLGIVWDRERDLLRALIARVDDLERRLGEMSRRERR